MRRLSRLCRIVFSFPILFPGLHYPVACSLAELIEASRPRISIFVGHISPESQASLRSLLSYKTKSYFVFLGCLCSPHSLQVKTSRDSLLRCHQTRAGFVHSNLRRVPPQRFSTPHESNPLPISNQPITAYLSSVPMRERRTAANFRVEPPVRP